MGPYPTTSQLQSLSLNGPISYPQIPPPVIIHSNTPYHRGYEIPYYHTPYSIPPPSSHSPLSQTQIISRGPVTYPPPKTDRVTDSAIPGTVFNIPRETLVSNTQSPKRLYPELARGTDGDEIYAISTIPTIKPEYRHLWSLDYAISQEGGLESVLSPPAAAALPNNPPPLPIRISPEEKTPGKEPVSQPAPKSQLPISSKNVSNYIWDTVSGLVGSGIEAVDGLITDMWVRKLKLGAPPASESVVSELPVLKISSDHNEFSECPICQETWIIGEDAKLLPCKHYFHENCIGMWLGTRNSCPICRFELPTNNKSYERYRKKKKKQKKKN
jgi:hypothetical protein